MDEIERLRLERERLVRWIDIATIACMFAGSLALALDPRVAAALWGLPAGRGCGLAIIGLLRGRAC